MLGGVVAGGPVGAPPRTMVGTLLCGPSSSSVRDEVRCLVGCWVLVNRLWTEVLAPVGFPSFSLNTWAGGEADFSIK